MPELKYTVIKSARQYDKYCKILHDLDFNKKTKSVIDEIELLTLLIEKWDYDHYATPEADPVTLLKELMAEHNISQIELAGFLDTSKGYISEILNYKKYMSKHIIRNLAERFKIQQEAFNRPYSLVVTAYVSTRKPSTQRTSAKTKSSNHKKATL